MQLFPNQIKPHGTTCHCCLSLFHFSIYSLSLTTPTTVCFQRDPNPTIEAKSEWQQPFLPQLPSVIKETLPPSLKLNLYGNYPHYPNSLQFIKRPHPYSYYVFIQCHAQYMVFSLIQLF